MGSVVSWIGDVLETLRGVVNGDQLTTVKADPGSGNTGVPQLFSCSGVDALPLEGDKALAVAADGIDATGGFADTRTPPEALQGEILLYSRQPGQPAVRVGRVWVKQTGEIAISNPSGSFTLKPDGSVDANGATITTDGDVVSASGISLSNHTHPASTTATVGTGSAGTVTVDPPS